MSIISVLPFGHLRWASVSNLSCESSVPSLHQYIAIQEVDVSFEIAFFTHQWISVVIGSNEYNPRIPISSHLDSSTVPTPA